MTLPAGDKLAEKRAQDMAIYGGNLDMERKVALALVDAWRKMGLPGMLLNDSTKGDLLLGLNANDDLWLPVQLKTTAGPAKGGANTNPNPMWFFNSVTGYANMPVVCWRCDCADGWIYDGSILDERGIHSLGIIPNAKNCQMARARFLKMEELVQWLQKAMNTSSPNMWSRVTEHTARHSFASKSHEVEMKGLDKYKDNGPITD